MSKKIIAYLFLMLPALLTTSCLTDQEDIFDKSASIRSAEYLENARKVLTSAENGWVMNYYPDNLQSFGGYSYVLTFDENNVTAYFVNGKTETRTLSDGSTEEVPVPETSIYSLTNEDGPCISFDTYNSYLHYFATPSSGEYEAKGGDFIFIILNISEDQNTITLKGNRSGNLVRLYRNTETPVKYISDCISVTKGQLYETFVKDDVTMELDLESQQVTVAVGEETAKSSYIITNKGIKFYEPLTVAGRTFDSFDYNEANHSYTSKDIESMELVGKLPDGWRSYEDLAGRYRVGTADDAHICTITANGDGESYTISNLDSRLNGTATAYYKFTRGSFVISPQPMGMYGSSYYAWLIAISDNAMAWDTSIQFKGRNSATDPLTITFSGGEYTELWTYAFTDDPPTGDGRAGYFTQFESPFTLVRVD